MEKDQVFTNDLAVHLNIRTSTTKIFTKRINLMLKGSISSRSRFVWISPPSICLLVGWKFSFMILGGCILVLDREIHTNK